MNCVKESVRRLGKTGLGSKWLLLFILLSFGPCNAFLPVYRDGAAAAVSAWRYMATPPHAYTPKHIDEVRVEWVRFLMKYHIK
ncbi:hypothetical protein OROGR_012148 [Orobanche gracilis]